MVLQEEAEALFRRSVLDNITGNSVYRSTVEYHGPLRGERTAPFLNRLVGAFNGISCCSCRTDSVEYVAAADRLVDRLKPFPAVKAVIIDILHLTDTGLEGDLDMFEDSLNTQLNKLKEVICANPSDMIQPVRFMSDKSLKTRLRFESGITQALNQVVSIIEPEESRTNYGLIASSQEDFDDRVCGAISAIQYSCVESAEQKKQTFQISAQYDGVNQRSRIYLKDTRDLPPTSALERQNCKKPLLRGCHNGSNHTADRHPCEAVAPRVSRASRE